MQRDTLFKTLLLIWQDGAKFRSVHLLKDCSFQEKQNKKPLVKKGLNYTMMTNNAIKKLSGSLVFTQELSEAEMHKWTLPGI